VSELKIQLPPLEIQQQITAEIETERALVVANYEQIERFEKKVQDTICKKITR
jgi:restriction endonuclease S subunit